MSKYPISLVSSADMPDRADGTVIYGHHMNAVQTEIIQIEKTLGLGFSETMAVPSLLDGGFETLADRLADESSRLTQSDHHRQSSANVHGVAGSVVGTTDTQTLTNKTLVSPRVTGIADIHNLTFAGNTTFEGDVRFVGDVEMSGGFSINDFSDAQHDHTSAQGGGRIPPVAVYDSSSGKDLPQLLDERAPRSHTHSRSQIVDFSHSLSDHTGSLPSSRVTGLGSGAAMNVPSSPGTSASGSQLVRGDDPRLSNARTPSNHASRHSSTGPDPITPASIGAAASSHTHTRAQITNFSHAISDHTGDLPMSRVSGLSSALAGKMAVDGTANNAATVNGHKITVSPTAPAQAFVGDVWISY